MVYNLLLVRIYSDLELARFDATVLRPVANVDLPILKSLFRNPISIWGVTSSGRNLQIWNKMRPGDYVLFLSGTDKYYAGLISNKYRSKQAAYELWHKYHIYSRSFELLLFIDNVALLRDVPDPLWFRQLKPAKDTISIISENQISDTLTQKFLSNLVNTIVKTPVEISKKIEAIDYAQPPSRVKAHITRIIRDTVKSLKLKVKYNFACQICGYKIRVDSHYYCEVHHIWPLGEGGLDNFDNMIVLCPNHHAEFDMCAIGIDPKDGRTIIDRKGHVRATAQFLGNHKLNSSNLKYHFTKVI